MNDDKVKIAIVGVLAICTVGIVLGAQAAALSGVVTGCFALLNIGGKPPNTQG
jgi:hypothetical protein